MKPMTIEEAETKKSFLAKTYFLLSFATFCTVMYNIKHGRLNWVESEGLVDEKEAKLSPGKLSTLSVLNPPITLAMC